MTGFLAWWRRVWSDPHFCDDCGKPLSYGRSDYFDDVTGENKGRWWMACPKIEFSQTPRSLTRNFSGHRLVTDHKPDWLDCPEHEHVERSSLSPSTGWWE